MNFSSRSLWLFAVALVFAIGIFLRTATEINIVGNVYPLAGFKGVGFDERLYVKYTDHLLAKGISGYPDLVDGYIEVLRGSTPAFLPPLRFLYVGTAALWCQFFGVEPLQALHQIASLFSILTLVVSFGFMLRMTSPGTALAVLALMVCAPTQIHMGQHALVDGVFTFWTLLVLWLLWENLQKPSNPLLLAAYAVGLAGMTMTKESAAFVYLALLGILFSNHWLRFGTITRPLIVATLIGPGIGVVVLSLLAGGLDHFFTTYLLFASKNAIQPYAMQMCDGPWYRYMIDYMIVSPLVLVLAFGALFQLRREQRPELFMALFLFGTYLIMCNVKYGLNLRYANMWDLPLRLLAFAQLALLADRFGGKRRDIVLALAVAGLCAYELRQYWILAIQFDNLYELVTATLLRAVKILK